MPLPEIVGLLPMGGNGTRLRMPFPKPLAPIITDTGIEPVYWHALGRIRVIADFVYAITNSRTDACLLSSLKTMHVNTLQSEQPTLSGALGEAGIMLSRMFGENAWVAGALPDSIWITDPGKSMESVLDVVRGDGALAMFEAGADELDRVILALDCKRVLQVLTKEPNAEGRVHGWGAFVVRAGALATFTGDEKDGPQLGDLDMGWAYLGSYADLGTPDRYTRWHDMRGRS
jgi:hypothetical protein